MSVSDGDMGGIVFPEAIKSEKEVLGSILYNGGLLEEFEMMGICEDVFYDHHHALVWRSLKGFQVKGVLLEGKSVDLELLVPWLNANSEEDAKEKGFVKSGEVGADQVPTHLMADLISSGYSGFENQHAGRVLAAWRLRKIIGMCLRVAGKAGNQSAIENVEVPDLLAELEEGVGALERVGMEAAGEAVKDVVPRLLENFVERVEGRLDSAVVLSPWKNIAIGRGKMLVVGARPGMGKSAFIWNWAEWLSEREPVGVISLEMDADEFVGRSLTGSVGVNVLEATENYWKGLQGSEQQDVLKRLKAHASEMMGRQIWLDWCPGANHHRICQSMRVMARRHRVKVFYLDYLQKAAPASRQEITPKLRIDNALAAIQTTASKLGVTLIMAAQTDRECDKLAARDMRMHHLSDTSQTEKDADAIVYLGYNESPGADDDLGDKWKLRAACYAKFRGGKVGNRPMQWSGSRMRWERLAKQD